MTILLCLHLFSPAQHFFTPIRLNVEKRGATALSVEYKASHLDKFQNLLLTPRRQPSLKDEEKLKTASESQLEVGGRETELKGVSRCKLYISGYL